MSLKNKNNKSLERPLLQLFLKVIIGIYWILPIDMFYYSCYTCVILHTPRFGYSPKVEESRNRSSGDSVRFSEAYPPVYKFRSLLVWVFLFYFFTQYVFFFLNDNHLLILQQLVCHTS